MRWSGAAKRLDDGTFQVRLSAPPGNYTLRVTDDLGREAQRHVGIAGYDGEQSELDLHLAGPTAK